MRICRLTVGFISNLLDFSPHPRRNTSNSFYLLLLLCFFFGTIRILLYRSTASKPITTRIVGSTSADSGYGCKGRAELLVQGVQHSVFVCAWQEKGCVQSHIEQVVVDEEVFRAVFNHKHQYTHLLPIVIYYTGRTVFINIFY